MAGIEVISLRKAPEYREVGIAYFQKSWPDVLPEIYEDSISHSIGAPNMLPQWYLLCLDEEIIGCAGLITNDFISRGDLYPWLCALFVDEKFRGKDYATLLIAQAINDTRAFGFDHLYLCTQLMGYYEKKGFTYIGAGYHPWGESSRIYELKVS